MPRWLVAAWRSGRLGHVLALASLLAIVVAFPVAETLYARPSPGALARSLLGSAAFVAAALWLLAQPELAAGPVPRGRWLALGALVGVALALTLAADERPVHWLGLYFVVGAVACGALPPAAALRVLVAVTALAAALATRLGLGAAMVGVIALLMLVSGIGMMSRIRVWQTNRELQAAREELARLAVAEERLRFARDLHDLLGHTLSLITLKSELAGRLLPAAPERAAAEIRDVERAAREALREVRDAVAAYRQPSLAGELEGARAKLAAAGIACQVEWATGPLPAATDAGLAWAVREGVTNVIRHSRARRCTIRISREGRLAGVEVLDDGRGTGDGGSAPRPAAAGSGLPGLAERVATHGGSFAAGPLPAGGFRLQVSLPVNGAPIEATPDRVADVVEAEPR